MGIKILASMQKKASEFMKDLKKKIRNWWENFQSRHQLLIERLIVYLKYFVKFRFIPVYIFLFLLPIFSPTDAKSARYMLSALVQSQAAIIAIIITLTLIAVQLTASAYSPRVINIFRKNPDMWMLLGLYGTSIFYGLIVLRLVKEAEGGVVIQGVIWLFGHIPIFIWSYQNFSDHISFLFECLFSIALLLGIITFVALVPYIRNITDLLKPEKIIEQLATNITTECKEYNSRKDPIQPIVDIIRGSIRKYDSETTKVGLEAVTNRVIQIINSNCKEVISNSFCTRLQGVGKLAASVTDEQSTLEILGNLEEFGKDTAGKKLVVATNDAATSLEAVGIAAVRKGTELEDAVTKAVEALGTIGEKAAKNDLEKATEEVATSLGAVGIAAARKGTELEEVTKQAVQALYNAGNEAVAKGFDETAKQAVWALKKIGEAAVEIGAVLEEVVKEVARSLQVVGKKAVEEVGKEAVKVDAEKLKSVIWAVLSSLSDVGKTAICKVEEGTVEVVVSLGEIGKDAAKITVLDDETARVVGALREIGEDAAESEIVLKAVKKALRGLESAVGKDNLPNTYKAIISAFERMQELNKKTTKSTQNNKVIDN
jgi:hypothetical protein